MPTRSHLLTPVVARSSMFVPGDRGDLLAKAAKFEADALVADLEDAVASGDKDAALSTVEQWLTSLAHEEPSCRNAWVRINVGPRGCYETERLSRLPALVGVFVPKVESSDALAEVSRASLREDLWLAPMIESATGLVRLHEIAQSSGVFQLHMGELDLATDLGLSPGPEDAELAHARAQVVVASRHAGLVAPAGPVNPRFDDPATYRASTQALARMGFMGRDCIHPNQVGIANEVFSVDPSEVAWAHALLEEAQHHGGAYRDADGSMVDEAVLRLARSILARPGSQPRH